MQITRIPYGDKQCLFNSSTGISFPCHAVLWEIVKMVYAASAGNGKNPEPRLTSQPVFRYRIFCNL